MPDYRITMRLEGMESEGGHVRFADFLSWLQLQRKTLDAFDKLTAGEATTYFRVVDLSHSSPTTVTAEAVAIDPERDNRARLIGRYLGDLEQIRRGTVPIDLGANLLKDLRDLAKPVGRRIRSIALRGGERSVTIDDSIVASIDRVLEEVDISVGSIEGMMERYNAHRGANIFHIYPEFGLAKVACNFPEDLKKRAAGLVLRYVEVTGRMKFLRGADFAHEIEVEHIAAIDDEEEAPSFDSIRGIADGLNIPSEEVIRSERDAWED